MTAVSFCQNYYLKIRLRAGENYTMICSCEISHQSAQRGIKMFRTTFSGIIKGLILAFLFIAVMGLFMVTAQARTLQGGQAHTFANNDRHTAVFVTVNGTAAYDYVMRDANGTVTGYGVGVGRFQVMAGGETTIFAATARSVSFPAGRITIRNAATPLLRRINVPVGQSVVMENNHPTVSRRLVVDTSGGHVRYDLIVRDRHNQAVQVAEGLIFSNINIPAGGTATIHAADQRALTLIVPVEWDDLVQQTTQDGPAINSRTVQIGETVTITNGSANAEFTFRSPSRAGNSIIDYTYRRGAFDETIVRTDVTFEEKTIQPGFTWTVTVQSGQPLTLLVPREWLTTGLTITSSHAQAVQSFEIQPGQSLRLINTDLDAMYDVTVASVVPGMALQYDYVQETAFDSEFGIASDVRIRTLLPGGTLTISPSQHGALQVIMPTDWAAVTAEVITASTLFIRDIAPGQSLRVDNINEADFRHIIWHNRLETGAGLLDYIARDHEGQIDSFGVAEADRDWELAPGEAVSFTNREQTPLRVYFPYSWLGSDLEVTEVANPVLARQTVRPGEALEVVNSDQRYGRHIVVEHAAQPMGTPPEYHYAVRRHRETVDFGISQSTTLSLIARGQTVVAPSRGTALSVAIPAEWQGRTVTFVTGVPQPLHRTVLRPNARLNLNNRLNADVTVHIVGSYFLRWGEARTNESQRVILRNEATYEGDLTIPRRGQVAIIAAPGTDVEVWMPADWRSRLIR